MIIHGESGVGKTTLLEYLVAQAQGFHVIRITGVEYEMEMAYAGLHQMHSSIPNYITSLPTDQRDALQGALGLGSVRTPDGFLVALATLGLLTEAARDRPVLCVVDDAQWLDQASMKALSFTARRLHAESVALTFAVRTLGTSEFGNREPTGIPELELGGLQEEEARSLLRSLLPGRWDDRVIERIVAEARGIPLALVELSKESPPTEYAGGFGIPRARPLTDRIQAAFASRIKGLPATTRQLLLLAAADPTGQAVLLWRAAEKLGVDMAAASPAVAIGLISIGDQVTFAHPTVRSTAYWEATHDERLAVHRALANVTDPLADPARRAWHAAQGAPGPNEQVAAALERSAERAKERGALASAAAFMSRAVELTPDPGLRRKRALIGARAAHAAGSPDSALRLLSVVEAGADDERMQGELKLLRAQIAFATERGNDAPILLLQAARQIETHNVSLARETYLEAISAAMFAGPLAYGGGQLEAARAALTAPPAVYPPRPVDLLLDGTAARIARGHAAGVTTLQEALAAFRDPGLPDVDGLRWLWMAGSTAVGLWDQESWDDLSGKYLQLVRRNGQTAALPLALTMRIVMYVHTGELALASSLVDEVNLVSEAVGTPPPLYGALQLSAWQGNAAEVARLSRAAEAEALRRGEGNGLVLSSLAKAIVANGTGRYHDALTAAREASKERQPLEVGGATWALVEGIEAAARVGDFAEATDAHQRLVDVTAPSGTEWALGVEARARALLGEGDHTEAETHYREAIERLARTRVRSDLARTHLLYGEWLRRKRRRQAARQQLRTAHELFTSMGMNAFAERSARELRATGEVVHKHGGVNSSDLTVQESQIVRLVRDGLTNAEIGTRLFISPRTVEWHLRKAYGKLGVTSRRQLRNMAETRTE
ncbi:hypothetical protein ADL02_38250 [Streptomyces sp. NRRL WC-3723]|nr:hypothetical protein ADL02_38250 [Streptomyces sp. NRRL WC-3723]